MSHIWKVIGSWGYPSVDSSIDEFCSWVCYWDVGSESLEGYILSLVTCFSLLSSCYGVSSFPAYIFALDPNNLWLNTLKTVSQIKHHSFRLFVLCFLNPFSHSFFFFELKILCLPGRRCAAELYPWSEPLYLLNREFDPLTFKVIIDT